MSVEEKRISLNEIVNEVFKSKLMLFLILLVTIILTLFFAFNVNKPRWTGNLKIEKISSIDHNDFMALKEFDEIYSIKKDYLAKLFIEEIDVTTCNDLKYATELYKRFVYTMGGKEAVQAWIDKGWGPDEKATTTLTKILTPDEIVTKVDALTSYYKNYFEKEKKNFFRRYKIFC